MLHNNPKSQPLSLHRLNSTAGLTLVEVVIALAIIAGTVGASIAALSQMNIMAQNSRLLTGAQAVAQNHLDDAINRDWSRFTFVNDELPAPIRPGVHWVIPNMADANGNGLAAYYDSSEVAEIPFAYSSTEPTAPNVPIYEEDPLDPAALTVLSRVSVTSTEIEDIGYRLHRIDVVVEYTYRGSDYQMPLSTLRSWN